MSGRLKVAIATETVPVPVAGTPNEWFFPPSCVIDPFCAMLKNLKCSCFPVGTEISKKHVGS
jgi:hypothetical protein